MKEKLFRKTKQFATRAMEILKSSEKLAEKSTVQPEAIYMGRVKIDNNTIRITWSFK